MFMSFTFNSKLKGPKTESAVSLPRGGRRHRMHDGTSHKKHEYVYREREGKITTEKRENPAQKSKNFPPPHTPPSSAPAAPRPRAFGARHSAPLFLPPPAKYSGGAHAFKTLDISQGSVATHLRCGWISSDSILQIFS